jgi:hypothetical protein
MVFTTMSHVLSSYTSIAKTSQPINSIISENPKVACGIQKKRIDNLLNTFIHY